MSVLHVMLCHTVCIPLFLNLRSSHGCSSRCSEAVISSTAAGTALCVVAAPGVELPCYTSAREGSILFLLLCLTSISAGILPSTTLWLIFVQGRHIWSSLVAQPKQSLICMISNCVDIMQPCRCMHKFMLPAEQNHKLCTSAFWPIKWNKILY